MPELALAACIASDFVRKWCVADSISLCDLLYPQIAAISALDGVCPCSRSLSREKVALYLYLQGRAAPLYRSSAEH